MAGWVSTIRSCIRPEVSSYGLRLRLGNCGVNQSRSKPHLKAHCAPPPPPAPAIDSNRQRAIFCDSGKPKNTLALLTLDLLCTCFTLVSKCSTTVLQRTYSAEPCSNLAHEPCTLSRAHAAFPPLHTGWVSRLSVGPHKQLPPKSPRTMQRGPRAPLPRPTSPSRSRSRSRAQDPRPPSIAMTTVTSSP